MNIELSCSRDERRGLVRDSGVNAIDYLEVLGSQRTLLVHLFGPAAGLNEANLVIEGGVRVRSVRALWARPAFPFDENVLRQDERDRLASMPQAEREHALVVRTDTSGDFSTYTLRLVASRALADRPPDGFDPVLSEVRFSFKVDCPTDFDCAPERICDQPEPAPPPIDYLAKDYSSFRRLLLDRLSVVMPNWRERNPADVMVTLVELLSYVGDQLSYRQDAAATEAYLGTARLRRSVRRHARLLDYRVQDGVNARTWLSLEVAPGSDGAVLPAATQVLTGEPASGLVIAPEDVPPAVSRGAIVFETLDQIELREDRNLIEIHTWGDADCCLPAGATRATLVETAGGLDLRAGDAILLEEILGSESGLPADADPTHRHAVRLTAEPRPLVDPVGRPAPSPGDPPGPLDVLEVEWAPEDALPFPLCVRHHAAGPTAIARANVVLCDHGVRIENELLEPVGARRYRPVLAELGATHAVPYDSRAARAKPAADALAPDPRDALPWVFLDDGADRWEPERDLLGSDRFAASFVVEMEDDGRAHLRFGDDVLGRAPSPGTRFTATYRVGNGRGGNVAPGALTRVVAPLVDLLSVTNPLPAVGGTDPEPTEQVRLYAPQAFRTQRRAVTPADYAGRAQQHRQVQRAGATRRWTGSWHTVFITIDRVGGRDIDPAFERELRAFIDPYRLAGHDIEIDAPRYIALDIALRVCTSPGYVRANVKRALLETFSARDLPGRRRGWFHPDNLTFGQTLYLSPIVATAMTVPGVEWVEVVTFQRFGQPAAGELAAGQMVFEPLEIARLDNDPNRAENGRIDFLMEGGL